MYSLPCHLCINLPLNLFISHPPHDFYFFFFLNDPAPPEFSPLPLPAALPISCPPRRGRRRRHHDDRQGYEPHPAPHRTPPHRSTVPHAFTAAPAAIIAQRCIFGRARQGGD